MDQTKKRMQEKKENQTENSDHPKSQIKSLIELMYESTLSESTIRDNVSAFFMAGHETTANSLAWLISVFISHPEIRQKARQEVFDKVPDELSFNSLKELTYIDGLVKESLRMYPPASLLNGRFSKNDTVIGNVRVPAGMNVDLNLISMAHDPKIWVDPSVIRPERWLVEPHQRTKKCMDSILNRSSSLHWNELFFVGTENICCVYVEEI
jgi:cytochrome P450